MRTTVGQRHLAEVDPLDILDEKAAQAPDRFFTKRYRYRYFGI